MVGLAIEEKQPPLSPFFKGEFSGVPIRKGGIPVMVSIHGICALVFVGKNL